MSTAPVVERPPSPPTSNDGDFGLSHVANHLTEEDREQPRSLPSIRPRPLPAKQERYDDPSQHQIAQAQVQYYQQEPVSPDAQTYHEVHADQSQQGFYRTTGQRQLAPHTPPQEYDQDGSQIQTRSGRAIGFPIRRRSPSPRVKKSRAAKAGKSDAPVINDGLSVLTADYDTPVKDMNAWVNRSVATRMAEIEKKNGYISRPMNSFMLYRSAYAERVKRFCKENNHQIVSKVSGASWPQEPKEIRERYEKYASIERGNHAAAHPNYKFAPNKSGTKKRKDYDSDEDEDGEWEGSPRSSKRSRQNASRSRTGTPYDAGRTVQHPLAQHMQRQMVHPSSYEAANPYGTPQLQYTADTYGAGGYMQQNVVTYPNGVEEVGYERIRPFYPQGPQAVVGLPNDNQDLWEQPGSAIDPSLVPVRIDENGQAWQYFDQRPGQYTAVPQYAYPTQTGIHPANMTLTEGHGEREAEGDVAGWQFDQELQQQNYY